MASNHTYNFHKRFDTVYISNYYMPRGCPCLSLINSNIICLCILSQPRKEDIRTGAQRHRAKKKERIKSRIGKVKKLNVMLQKRLKTVKNKCFGLGHEM